MSACSMAETAASPAESVARLLGRPVDACVELAGGRNSRVYRMETGGKAVAVKLYFRHPLDSRDRLKTEFDSLSWLWSRGVREIPQPLASDPAANLAVYEFLEGSPIPQGAAGSADLDAALSFLTKLKDLGPAAHGRFAPASEAFFSAPAIAASVRARAERLDGAEADAARFVKDEVLPFLAERAAGLGEAELPPAERVLSPSDFGFHNALRRSDGSLRFYDFEYFGWDDPAKTLSDFLLHPAMSLGLDERRRFAQGFLARFGTPELRRRFPNLYPLFAAKWCLIMLNEYAPGHRERREFARGAATAPAERRRQLDLSIALLARVRSEMENFPYV